MVSYSWTPPNTGSAVEYYVIEKIVNGDDWVEVDTSADTSYVLSADVGDTVSIRVYGVDSSDRRGQASPPSEPYIILERK